jgi:hypothetical protein
VVKWIAEVAFTGVTGKHHRILHARIGVPRPSGRTAWACPVEVTGVLRRRLVYGEDALQALCLTLEFVGNTLYSQRARGLHLKYAAGHSVPLYAYFRLREFQRRLIALGRSHRNRRSTRPSSNPVTARKKTTTKPH